MSHKSRNPPAGRVTSKDNSNSVPDRAFFSFVVTKLSYKEETLSGTEFELSLLVTRPAGGVRDLCDIDHISGVRVYCQNRMRVAQGMSFTSSIRYIGPTCGCTERCTPHLRCRMYPRSCRPWSVGFTLAGAVSSYTRNWSERRRSNV